jgi:hypothetical protein
MRQRLQRVPEENEKVNAAFRYARAYLLVTAQRTALESGDFRAYLLLQDFAGCSRGEKLMLKQGTLVKLHPLKQIRFFMVMSYECNLFSRAYNCYSFSHFTLFHSLLK